MNEKYVSVIIPCFNDGSYIMETIRSVQNQTYPYVEIIVVDDGSTDNVTKEIIETLCKSNIKVFRTNHAGPAAARNCGIANAKGQYILPLDADDKIAPEYLEKAVNILDSNPNIGIVYCLAELFGERTGRWELPEYSLPRMLLDNVIFVSAVFRRKDWESVGGFCEELKHGMEDYDFWLSLIEIGCEVFQIPEVLFWYRIKPKSRTTKLKDNNRKNQDSYQIIFNNHKNLYKEHYDIVIPVLRNALLDQLYFRRRISEFFVVKYILTWFPRIKNIIKRMLK